MNKLSLKPKFDIQDFEIGKTNDVNFGSTVSIKIDRSGDLLHKLALKFTLPEINISYIKTTIREIISILGNYSIIWNTAENTSTIFTSEYVSEVLELINASITNLNITKQISLNILNLLPTVDPLSFSNIPLYENALFNKLFTIDQYNIQYNFLNSQKNDSNNKIVVNSKKILELMYNKFVEYVTNNNINYYSDENLVFLYNVEIANYIFDNSIQQLSASYIFNTAISNIYFGLESSFLHLDAYKIFADILSYETTNFNFNTSIILQKILDNIRYGLIKNVKMLLNVYDSLKPEIQFVFFRRLKSNIINSYDLSEQWMNVSLLNTNISDIYTPKFILAPEINEPISVNHKYSKYVNSEVNTMHVLNRTFMRDPVFSKYFDTPTIFARTNITSPGNVLIDNFSTLFIAELNIAFNNDITFLDNLYFLNYIPLLAANDIPIAIYRLANSYSFYADLSLQLTTLKNQLIIEIKNILLLNDNFGINSNISINNKQTNSDLIYHFILKNNNFILYSGLRYTLLQYIIVRYTELLQSYTNITYTPLIKNILLSAVNVFNTPKANIPTYQTYINNGNNITSLQINQSGLPILSDVISSIWGSITTGIISNFNDMYNNKILNTSNIIPSVFGIEMKRYITTIIGLYFAQPTNINYWFDTPISLMYTPTFTYLNSEISRLSTDITYYYNNKQLLGSRDLVISNSFYYQTYINIIDELIDNKIEILTHIVMGNEVLLYYHEDHGTVNDKVQAVKIQLLDLLYPIKNTPLDIFISVKIEFEKLITQTINPFVPNTNKWKTWNNFWLPAKSFDTIIERGKYVFLFDQYLDSNNLFSKKSIFENKYNNFSSDSDVYDFMIDELISNSSLYEIPSIGGNTPISKYQNIVDYYAEKNKTADILISNLQSLSIEITNLADYGKDAKFSWIENIGHHIIEYIEVKINDEVIDRQTGELLEIVHNTSKMVNKENKFRELIGNSGNLTLFDTTKKKEKLIIVPLKFWFCNFIEYSLPLISLIHAELRVYIKFRNLTDVSFSDKYTEYTDSPKLKSVSLIANNIYVNEKEKYVLSKKINDYLITKWQYYDNLIISSTDILSENNVIGIKQIMEFSGTIKELFFALQPISNVTNKQYGIYTEGIDRTIDSAKIEFSGREREVHKSDTFYNYVITYSYYKSDVQEGLLCYPFSINPLDIQPSGCVNFDKIKSITLFVKPTDVVLTKLNEGIKYRLIIYASEYKLLRITNSSGTLLN